MKTTKIYNDEKEIYSGNCYVNIVIFRGRIYGDFKEVGQGGVKLSQSKRLKRPGKVYSKMTIYHFKEET